MPVRMDVEHEKHTCSYKEAKYAFIDIYKFK